MFTPGAKRSTVFAPKFENEAFASLASEAPTQTRFVEGIWQRLEVVSSFAPALPAESTYKVFGWRSTAAWPVGDAGASTLALTIGMPSLPATSQADATEAGVPSPFASSA